MEVIKILGQTAPDGATEILYIVPENKACVISTLNIVNGDDVDATISIRIGSLENIEYNTEITWIERDMIVYAKCSAQRLKGVTLAAGDIVAVTSLTNYVTFALFGSEFTQDFSYTEEGGGGYGYGEIPI